MFKVFKVIRTIIVIPFAAVWILLTAVMAILHNEFTFVLIGKVAEKSGWHKHV
jgi:hypothetical protein